MLDNFLNFDSIVKNTMYVCVIYRRASHAGPSAPLCFARIIEGLPSFIPKSIVEVLNRLENDEDNLFSWKLTRSQDKFSLTVSCKLRAKTPNKAKDDNKVTGRTSVKPVKRRRSSSPVKCRAISGALLH